MTTHRKPQVSTTQYQFSHGHLPRGFGRWMFIVRWYAGEVETCETISLPESNYTQARLEALVRARACNAFRVEVCP